MNAIRSRRVRFFLSVASALYVAFVPSSGHAGSEDEGELPATYSGGGLTLVVKVYDKEAMTCSGTVHLRDGRVSPFRARIRLDVFGNEIGFGQVQTPDGPRPIRSRESDDGITVE